MPTLATYFSLTAVFLLLASSQPVVEMPASAGDGHHPVLSQFPEDLDRGFAPLNRSRRATRPCLAQAPGNGPTNLAAGDPCAVGRHIASLGPCRRSDDCAAVKAWREQYGDPGVESTAPGER